MGAVSSRLGEAGSVLLTNRSKFTISKLSITDVNGNPIVTLLPDERDPRMIYAAKDESTGLIEYVQDFDPHSTSPILLKLSNDLGLLFRFTIKINGGKDDIGPINGLTFLNAGNNRALDLLMTKELHSDPNIQKKDNVTFIGDYAADSDSIEFEWVWRWRPPNDIHESYNGWRNTCCFAEYNKRDHKFDILARFSFWVQDFATSIWTASSSPHETNSAIHLRSPTASEEIQSISTDNNTFAGMEASSLSPKSIHRVSSPLTSNVALPPAAQQSLGGPSKARIEDLSQPEDGPLFRATVTSLEKKTAALKIQIKRLLKRATQAYDAQAHHCEALGTLLDVLRESSKSLTSFQPAVDIYFNAVGRDILRFERQSCIDLQTFIVEPLRRLYEVDIKAADAKKREFDEESREYYSWLSRYLSMKNEGKGKKKTDSELKYQDKRKIFELKRFDYFSYIHDLHGGRKEQEISFQLSAYAEAQMNHFGVTSKSIQQAASQVEAMITLMKENKEDWGIRRTEREEKRRALERSSMPEPTFSSSPASPQTSSSSLEKNDGSKNAGTLSGKDNGDYNYRDQLPLLTKTTSASSLLASGLPVAQQTTKMRTLFPRNVEEKDEDIETAHRKEGLLWAMSRPGSHSESLNLNKPGWHKFWVVLAGGRLWEYTNWKQSLDLNKDPVNLKMATVREARNSERRFCFEIITPHYRRVYQATSEEDMHSWITAISNAITSSLEGNSSIRSLAIDTASASPTSGSHNVAGSLDNIFNKASPLNTTPSRRVTPTTGSSIKVVGPRLEGSSNALFSESEEQEHFPTQASLITGAASDSMQPCSANESLLSKMREADSKNSICADCGATSKVEWVSINLMVILCIDCSGVHRSLGTHISKIRSLTLDTTSFTPDLVEALLLMGNTKANEVWEALPAAEEERALISSNGTSTFRATALAYITKKYVDRVFVSTVQDPNVYLREAVKSQDIFQVLHALASNADPNVRSNSQYSLFVTAMAYAKKDAITFPIVELLVQYGAVIPRELPGEIKLSNAAQAYFLRKSGRKIMATGGNNNNSQSMDDDASSSTFPSKIASALKSSERQTVRHVRESSLGSQLQRKLSTRSPSQHK
ncbi:hypothetical protein V1511DRAFT_520914 [Dipodascopsis uninucleata]